MKTKVLDLIDFEKVDSLLEGFNKTTGFVTAILDLEGNVLSKSGWRQMCTEFHRINPETSKNCTISDTELAGKMAEGENYHFYKCLNGLVDVAVPIVINGEHIANLFSGQFFFEEPDRNFFKKQAEKYGFDEKKYLKALEKVPVVSKEKVQESMDFLLNMTQLISEMTFQKMQQTELNKDLRTSEEYNRMLFTESPIGLAMTTMEGQLVDVNPAYCKIIGRTVEETLTLTYWDITPEKYFLLEAEQIESIKSKGKYGPFEKEYIHKNGNFIPVQLKGKIIERNGEKLIWSSVEDITERKKAEISLREEKEQKRVILELAGDPIFLKDNDHRIIFANQAFLNLFGLDEKSVIGKTLAEKVPKNERKQFLLVDRNVLDTGIPDYREEELTVGQLTNTIITRKTRYIDESGNKFLVGSIHNITERITTEKKLKENEQRLSSIFDAVGDVIFMLKVEAENQYRFVTVNKSFARVTGIPEEMIIGKLLSEVIPKASLPFVLNEYQVAIKTKSLRRWEETSDYPNGQLVGEASISPMYDDKGNCTHLVGSVHDITENKKAEKALQVSEDQTRVMFENAPLGIALVDSHSGRILRANYRYAEIAGRTEEEMGKIDWMKITHPDDVQKDLDNMALLNAAKISGFNMEKRYIKPDGSNVWVNLTVSPIKFEGNSEKKHLAMVEDITKRKQTEKALYDSEELLRLSLELANVAAWEFDFTTNLMSRSENHDKLYGLETQEKWSFETFTNATHPDDREMSAAIIQQSAAIGGPDQYRFDFRVIYPNNSIHWLNVIGKVIKRAKEGQGILVRGFLIDITERKQAEEELREAKELLSNAIDNAPAGMCLVKMDGYFNTVNKSLCEMFDYTEMDLQSKTFLEVTHPDDRAIGAESVQSMIKGKIEKVVFEKRYLKKNGDFFHAMVQSSVLKDEKGNPIYFFTHIENITERKLAQIALKKSEEKYKLLFELLPDTLLVTRNGLVDEVNNAALKLFGLKSKSEIIQSDPMKWVEPESFAIAQSRLNKLNENPVKMPLAEYSIFKKNGEIRMIDAQSASMNDEKGLFSLAVLRDITEKKKIENQIRELNQSLEQKVKDRTAELQAINKELETFTYSVSHDLKAPLRGIDGYSKLLLDLYKPKLNDEAQAFIEAIRSSTLQMNQLIEDLLDYSRLDRSKLSMESIKIKDLTKTILSLYHADLEAANFKVNVNIANIDIISDPKGLTIALRNLIENAIKFTKGNPEPLIQIEVKEKDLLWIISVNDNGVGFDMQYHQMIFDIFQRLQRAEDFPGTGIGLAMVSKSMQRMHGRVWADSTPGVGSTFYLEIPKNL